MRATPSISVVLPVFNEGKNIVELLREIVTMFQTKSLGDYEIVVVDDCSSDNSVACVEAYGGEAGFGASKAGVSSQSPIRILRLSVRSGQSETLMRGMLSARGEYIVTMDSDGQHNPADIPGLLCAMKSSDMVCGIRKTRVDGVSRLISSKIANGFRNRITGDSLADAGCTFRVLRRSCLPLISQLRGKLFGCEFFFHPLLLARHGCTVVQLPVAHRARRFGKSKYRLFRGRLLRGIAACIRIRGMLKQLQKQG